jgi:hypothetical protein
VNDFLKFKKMMTPIIIQILFWIGVAVCVIAGIIEIVSGINTPYGGGGSVVFMGILLLLLGPILVRVWCELMLVLFSIHDTLIKMKNKM